jgi:hypothetical protein
MEAFLKLPLSSVSIPVTIMSYGTKVYLCRAEPDGNNVLPSCYGDVGIFLFAL